MNTLNHLSNAQHLSLFLESWIVNTYYLLHYHSSTDIVILINCGSRGDSCLRALPLACWHSAVFHDGGYPNDIFPRFFRQRDVRKFGPRDAVFTSIQRRSTGVDFSPLEQANKSLLHALTVVGFIRFPLATRMRRLSKPKLHSYSVFPCARLAVAAVRVVELQLRRSLDRFGGPSLRHRACGA